MKKFVQSFICNFTFDSCLEELIETVKEDHFLAEEILGHTDNEWTIPKWAKKDDIVLFMFAKTANQRITRLRTYYNNNKNLYSKNEQKMIEYGINHGLELYKKYGGKIIAIGKVAGTPFYDEAYNDNQHWKGRISAAISNVHPLENPIDISEFNNFILVSRQSSITGVFGNDFDRLKEIIVSKNKCPHYFLESVSTPLPLREINENNWLNLSNLYRRQFFLEKQFRTFYVDYFLKQLSDDKKIYMECRCRKNNCTDTFVDNVIKYHDRYLCIEVKLNKDEEKNIIGQLEQYCNCDAIDLKQKINKDIRFYNYSVLLIDTLSLYVYNSNKQSLSKIIYLDDISNNSDIEKIREDLITKII